MRIALLALAAMFATPHASGADARSVLAAPRQRIESADYRITGRLVRVDEKGARTSLGVTIKAHWFPGVLRVLLEVISPVNARAHILLEMRPDGEDAIRIAHPGDSAPAPLPFDRWSDGPLGPGFSYEDFLEPQYFWPEQALAGETTCGARKCDILKSASGAADRTHYAEVTTLLDHAIGFPVTVEKRLKGSEGIKEFTYFGLRHDQGVWSAHQVEAKIRGQEGSTLLIIDRGSASAHLGAADFSPVQLTHF
ncbi:MAG: outer membrane lipoprotein-sorting protein [Terracidiphilus sp.]